MRDEWRYILNSGNCYISVDGDVQQNGEIVEPYRFGRSGHRAVDLMLETNEYDNETGERIRGEARYFVWQLMAEAWFTKWPDDSELFFMDGDPWNCSIENIRAWSRRLNRVVLTRDDEWGVTFDKRLRGKVEIVETGQRFEGVAAAAKAVGGTKSGVSFVLSGRLETHRGFHFRWV